MPSWFQLQQQLNAIPLDQRGPFVQGIAQAALNQVAAITQRNAIVYATAFLQKPQVPGTFMSLNPEDINGFMACLQGMDCKPGLTLLLHTPGGQAEAAEAIVDYLWSKFDKIEALIPTYAMSAGTMIALACDRIIMGRQSQLGPTDPQIIINGNSFSAHSIADQFEEAKKEIIGDPRLATVWAPVLQPFGPALLQNARKAVAYGNGLVREWLAKHMFAGRQDPAAEADRVAKYFGGSQHGSHGHRINRTEARAQGLVIEDLENRQKLQEAALTLYHALTTAFDSGPLAKIVMSSTGSVWMKNVNVQMVIAAQPPGSMPMPPGGGPPVPAPAASPGAPGAPIITPAPGPSAGTTPTIKDTVKSAIRGKPKSV